MFSVFKSIADFPPVMFPANNQSIPLEETSTFTASLEDPTSKI